MPDGMNFGLIGYGAWGRFHARSIAKAPDARLGAIVAARRRERGRGAGRSPRSGHPSGLSAAAGGPGDRGRRGRGAEPPPRRDRDRRARSRQARPPREADGDELGGLRPHRRGREPVGQGPDRRARDAPLAAMGADQDPDRRGRDRRAAARQRRAVPLPLSPGLRRLALRPEPRRLLDPGGADPLLRLDPLVPLGRGASGARPGDRHGRRRHVGRALGAAPLPERRHGGRQPNPRRLRAPSGGRGRRQRRRHPLAVVRRHGPYLRADREPAPQARRDRRPNETIPIERSGEVFELEAQAQAAVEAFRSGKPIVSPEEGRAAVAVCLAAERSAREGVEVVVE